MADGPAKKGAFYIPALDGIRTVAFFIVFFAHAGLAHVIPGGFGVTVFFFLSGFLITSLLRRELELSGDISFKDFYLRRALRIFPPMYLTLGVAVILSLAGVLPEPLQASRVGAQALHLTNYFMIFRSADGMPAGTGVYWSLAVEEHFYLAFPLLLWLMRRLSPSRQALLLLIACVVVLIWRCVLVFAFDSHSDRTYLATDTRIDNILFGCIMGVWMNPYMDEVRVRRTSTKVLILVAAALLLTLSFVYRDPAFRETLRYTLQGMALFGVFYVVVANDDWLAFRWLQLRFVRFLGYLSYTLYLSHQIAIYGVQSQWPEGHPVAQGALAFALSFLFSYAMYRVVETPLAALRSRLHKKPA